MKAYDAIIIGAGPAGLSAAIYLARFRRKTLMIDTKKGRSSLPGTYANIMGFYEPIGRNELRKLGSKQAQHYGAEKLKDKVIGIEIQENNKFRVMTEDKDFFSKNIIFCTGINDNWIEIDDYQNYLGHTIHSCPVCAGYESIDKKIVLVGSGNKISGLAMYMLTYTNKITIVTDGKAPNIDPENCLKLEKSKIPVYNQKIENLTGKGYKLKKVILSGGIELNIDVLYTALGITVNSELAEKIGVKTDDTGLIITDSYQKTNLDNVYAAGDVTNFDSKQVVTAMYEGFMAAKSIHSDLLKVEISNI